VRLRPPTNGETYTLTQVSKERSGIERALHALDGMRGLVGSLLIGAIGVAAIRAGGTAGWAIGMALSLLCVIGVTLVVRG
jgi:hypothetical protein